MTLRATFLEDAVCAQVDPEIFFPEVGTYAVEAKMVCRTCCPVREQCLDWAMEHGETEGVWGGLSYRERRNLRASLNKKAARRS